MGITISTVKKMCIEAFEKAGYNFADYGIEVVSNNRSKKTLGFCAYSGYEKFTPKTIGISTIVLENDDIDFIRDVVYHECAHALVTIETKKVHRHDACFKAMCARIGTTADTPTHNTIDIIPKENYKYNIFCEDCGYLDSKSRMCKTLQLINSCVCPKCKKTSLYYKQNW